MTAAVGSRMRLETVGRPRMAVSVKNGEKPLDVMRSVITAMDGAGKSGD